MQIAIVSGKGGAGKTTLATRLFMSTPGSTLLDCDTEEPNAALFLDIESETKDVVETGYPIINEELCNNCGLCAGFCAFGAILSAPKVTFAMAEKCHDCGGCALICPRNAITYGKRPVGTITGGKTEYGSFAYGELNVGEYSGVRIIRRLRREAMSDNLVWIDGPPGTACSAVAAVEDVDFAVLVGEPTPFGVSDMAMAVEMLENLEIPFAVVVNKAGIGDGEIYEFCRMKNLNIIGEIPFDRSMAEELARGIKGWGSSDPSKFSDIAGRILTAVAASRGDSV